MSPARGSQRVPAPPGGCSRASWLPDSRKEEPAELPLCTLRNIPTGRGGLRTRETTLAPTSAKVCVITNTPSSHRRAGLGHGHITLDPPTRFPPSGARCAGTPQPRGCAWSQSCCFSRGKVTLSILTVSPPPLPTAQAVCVDKRDFTESRTGCVCVWGGGSGTCQSFFGDKDSNFTEKFTPK